MSSFDIKNNIYKLPKEIYVKCFLSQKDKKQCRLNIKRWNKILKKEFFKEEDRLFVFLKKEYQIIITDIEGAYCDKQYGLVGYSRVYKNKNKRIVGGTIFICKKNINFHNRTNADYIEWSKVLLHELGHFIFIDHIAKSGIMKEHYYSNMNFNKFDKEKFPLIFKKK